MKGALLILLSLVMLTGCVSEASTENTLDTDTSRVILVRPESPNELVAVASDCSATLTWALPVESRDKDIEVYRWTTGMLPVLTAALSPGTTTYNDSNLTNGTTYFYLIRIKDKSGSRSDCTAMAAALPIAPLPVNYDWSVVGDPEAYSRQSVIDFVREEYRTHSLGNLADNPNLLPAPKGENPIKDTP